MTLCCILDNMYTALKGGAVSTAGTYTMFGNMPEKCSSPTMRQSSRGTVTTAEWTKAVASHGSTLLANLSKDANWRNLGGSGHNMHKMLSTLIPI